MRLRKLQFQARTFALISLVGLLVVIATIIYFTMAYLNTSASVAGMSRDLDVVFNAVLRQGAIFLLAGLFVALFSWLMARRNRRAIHIEQERIEAGLRHEPHRIPSAEQPTH